MGGRVNIVKVTSVSITFVYNHTGDVIHKICPTQRYTSYQLSMVVIMDLGNNDKAHNVGEYRLSRILKNQSTLKCY